MDAAILTIGDEVLIGQVVNTNAGFISKELFSIGIPVRRIITVPDTGKDIINELGNLFKTNDIVISTGGLGPTHDDITVKCIAKYFKKKLVFHKPTNIRIKKIFKRRNLPYPKNIIEQSIMPVGAQILENASGTAPGILVKNGRKIFCALPGVPHEMEQIMRKSLIPFLKKFKIKSRKGKVLLQKTLHTIGIGESFLSQRLGDLNEILYKDKDSNLKLAFLPSNFEVRLRITVEANNLIKARRLLNTAVRKIKSKAKDYIYSYEEKPIEYATGRLLRKMNLTIAVAESCTGGLVCSKLTNVPGSSNYMVNGIVAYSNDSKLKLLSVKQKTLDTFGAVSKQTAIEMAEGIRNSSNTDIGISTTGIAGPSGATRLYGQAKTKPVGLAWIGYSDKKICYAKEFIFTKERLRNKEITSKMAIEIVRRELLQSAI